MVDYRPDSAGKVQENSLKTVIPDWSEYVLPQGQSYNPADVKKVVPPAVQPLGQGPSPAPKDPTAKEYSEWYQRVSPELDKEHKGYLTFGDVYYKDGVNTAVPDWSEYVLPTGKSYTPAEVRKAKPTPYENPFEKIDPTAKEYRDWYQRVSPVLDKEQKGYLSVSDRGSAKANELRGKDEAMLVMAEKHLNEVGNIFNMRVTADGVRSLAQSPPEKLKELKEDTERATKLVKVADWIRDHKDALPQYNGVIPYSGLETASHSAKFEDPESQRMLHFLQTEYSAMSILRRRQSTVPSTGIPVDDLELRQLVEQTSSSSTAGEHYSDKYQLAAGLAGMYLGRAAGIAVGHQWLGMGAGALAGSLAGQGVGAFNYYVLKKQPYSEFTKELNAAVGDS